MVDAVELAISRVDVATVLVASGVTTMSLVVAVDESEMILRIVIMPSSKRPCTTT